MPKLLQEVNQVDSDIGSDDGDVFEESKAEADVDSKEQLNGELQDEAERSGKEEEGGEEEEEEEEYDENKAPKQEELDEPEEDEDPAEDEYVVEAITSHRIRNGRVEYYIKWLGYNEADNTWEPEDNLLPHAAKLLTQYHIDIGGPPTAKNVRKSKSNRSLRRGSTLEESPAPKRQKRNGTRVSNTSSEEVGTWLPPKQDWEPYIARVETVEKNDEGNLTAYILFKNGRKTKVGMDQVYQHCPRPMLKFYEDHLKFN